MDQLRQAYQIGSTARMDSLPDAPSSTSSNRSISSSTSSHRNHSTITPFDTGLAAGGSFAQSSPRQLSDQPWSCAFCHKRNNPTGSVLKRCIQCKKKCNSFKATRLVGSGISGVASYAAPIPHQTPSLLQSPSQSRLRGATPRVPSFPIGDIKKSSKSIKKKSQASSLKKKSKMLAPNARQQRKGGLGQITSPNPVSNFAGRHHTNNVPYGSTTMTDSLSFVQPLPNYTSHTSTSSSSSSSSTSTSNAQSMSAVWKSAWPRLKQMGWSRRERGTRGYDFFRPFARPSIAKYGTDKFRDEQNVLNGLNDLEFAEAMGQKAGPSGNVIEEEERSGEDDEDDEEDDEEDDDEDEDDEDDEDEEEENDIKNKEDEEIFKNESFDLILEKYQDDLDEVSWSKLQDMGWKWKPPRRNQDNFYTRPDLQGIPQKDWIKDTHYFRSIDDIKDKVNEYFKAKNRNDGNESGSEDSGSEESGSEESGSDDENDTSDHGQKNRTNGMDMSDLSSNSDDQEEDENDQDGK